MMDWRGACTYTWAVIAALLVLIAEGTVHLLDWWSPGDQYGLFPKLEPEVWDKFDSEIVNTDWLFYIWVVVYMLQIVWVLYGLHLPCRGTHSGNLHSDYPILPTSCFLLYILALIGHFGWLLLWTSDYFVYSPICLAITCVVSYVILVRAANRTRDLTPYLQKERAIGVVWENRWVVHNSMAAYATWATVSLLQTLTIIIQEKSGITENTAGYIFLGVIMAFLGIWFAADIFLAKNTLHAVITPYIVVSITLAAVLVKNVKELDYYFTISVVFLGFSLLIIFVKLCMMCWYKRLAKDKYLDGGPPRREIPLEHMHHEQIDREGRLILGR